jgi:ligand-binding sensor domain-containing protein
MRPIRHVARWRALSPALAAFWFLCPAHAQYRFDSWTADNGLPQNIIRDIQQTPDGYLWLATLDGLARFDGIRFTVYNKANSPGIGSTRFTSIYEDRNGDLWLGTEASGVTRYRKGSFTTYTTQNGLPHSSATAIMGGDDGRFWVLSGGSIAEWQASAERFVDITPKEITAHFDGYQWEGGAWASDDTGLHCFELGRFVTYPLPRGLSANQIWGVARAQDGTIWLETVDGRQLQSIDGEFRVAPRNTPGGESATAVPGQWEWAGDSSDS